MAEKRISVQEVITEKNAHNEAQSTKEMKNIRENVRDIKTQVRK